MVFRYLLYQYMNSIYTLMVFIHLRYLDVEGFRHFLYLDIYDIHGILTFMVFIRDW